MNNLAIFLNNTDSEIKLKLNEYNFNKLKNNFDYIIIFDIDNVFSKNLKNQINNKNIIKYILNNNSIKNNEDDLNYNKIKSILPDLSNINYDNINYVTFISDNYIYLEDLQEYFEYINKHNLDFYSFTDSSEIDYHFQLYLFSINYKVINKFLHIFNEYNEYNENNFHLMIHKLFDRKMPYLKIAYVLNNIEKNIFYNDDIYKNLLKSYLLPIISINKLIKIQQNFKYLIYNKIPKNFDLSIYSLHEDLKNLSKDKLYDHFLNYGQFELRKYSKFEYILPCYLRQYLIKENLITLFDLPDNFDIYKYIEDNPKLVNFNKFDHFMYWLNYGKNIN